MTRPRRVALPTADAQPPSRLSSSTQAQLRRLLEANRLAVEHLDLSQALRSILEAAVELVGAAYGALGVLGPDGKLDEFIHVGMDAETVTRIGRPPAGLGLLGALIADPRPVRLDSMGGDERSVGVPEHHPPMDSFLGVPLEVRGQIFGHLYLADPSRGRFSTEDQILTEALATTAGVAIAHARLFQESTRREKWTTATSQITHELLSNDAGDDLRDLDLIARRVRELTEAALVVVVLTHGASDPFGDLVVDHAVGVGAADLIGVRVPMGDNLVRRCLTTRRPQLTELFSAHPGTRHLLPDELGPAMAVPLPAPQGVRGSLLVLRPSDSPLFTEFDLDVATALAGQAALALDLAAARSLRTRNRALEERDRIARDLHDHVIQRLFATGLSIQALGNQLPRGEAADRIDAQIEEIDATIRQIRTTIFGLRGALPIDSGLRHRILEVVTAAAVTLSSPPEVVLLGPLDVLVPPEMYAEVVAVLREAVTNAGRHARARHVTVTVSADLRLLAVEVVDDGRGMAPGAVRSGLANLDARARALGGRFEVGSPVGGRGTRLLWSVPLGSTAQA